MVRILTFLTVVIIMCGCNKIAPINVEDTGNAKARTGFNINAGHHTLYGERQPHIKFRSVHAGLSESAEAQISTKCQKDLLRLSTTPSL